MLAGREPCEHLPTNCLGKVRKRILQGGAEVDEVVGSDEDDSADEDGRGGVEDFGSSAGAAGRATRGGGRGVRGVGRCVGGRRRTGCPSSDASMKA